MGITNLLKELKPITDKIHVSNLSGQRCGIDISCWLHRGAHSCALELISGQHTTKYLNIVSKSIAILRSYNITSIIVLDGAQLPMKASEEQRRNSLRKNNERKAIECIKSGNTDLAWKYAQRAIRITESMTTEVIKLCIKHNIKFVCAPYEADAQLAYMYKNKEIDFVITDDSDLILYGVKNALYKFDPNCGTGDFINMDKIKKYSPDHCSTDKTKSTNLCSFLRPYGQDYLPILIIVCVLSGCDYVANLKGIGIQTAIKYYTQYGNTNHVLNHLLAKKSQTAPNDYRKQFKCAVLTFSYQRAYDTNKRKLVHLNPLTGAVGKNLSGLDFLGMEFDNNTAQLIAEGKIDARSFKTRDFGSIASHNLKVKYNQTYNSKEKLLQLGISTAELRFAIEANGIALIKQRNVVHITISQLWKQRIKWLRMIDKIGNDEKLIFLMANIAKFHEYLYAHNKN